MNELGNEGNETTFYNSSNESELSWLGIRGWWVVLYVGIACCKCLWMSSENMVRIWGWWVIL